MQHRSADTIVAVATPNGRGAIGVVRLSGPASSDIGKALSGIEVLPRHATSAVLRDGTGGPLDSGLILFFPGPKSYTGEDCLEFQCHGGPAVLAGVLGRCLELGARPARPGEFTERAFLNGKLDLAQAEAVADLIEASSKRAVQAALQSLDGAFSRDVVQVAAELSAARTIVEALLDFPEEDLGSGTTDHGVAARIDAIHHMLCRILERARAGQVLREGARVVLIGAPNAGKSSLLNALTGEDLAIVTDVPGTTRDLVKGLVNWDGIMLEFVDTAGLRETQDQIEQLGIGRTKSAAAVCDLALFVVESSDSGERAEATLRLLGALPGKVIVVRSKSDLTSMDAMREALLPYPSVRVSTRSGEGLPALRRVILGILDTEAGSEGVYMARQRHLDALARALEDVARAREVSVFQGEILAEELRHAEEALGEITGRRTSEDLLGDIFSKFCIGK